MSKVHVVSYTRSQAMRWAQERNIPIGRLVIMILPGAFRIKRYSIMLEYSKQYHWSNKYERI